MADKAINGYTAMLMYCMLHRASTINVANSNK